jgi:hypothetical protein
MANCSRLSCFSFRIVSIQSLKRPAICFILGDIWEMGDVGDGSSIAGGLAPDPLTPLECMTQHDRGTDSVWVCTGASSNFEMFLSTGPRISSLFYVWPLSIFPFLSEHVI